MKPWKDIGTALDRDDIVVSADMLADATGHYPVDVWSLADNVRLSRFETVVDFGGRRLALASVDDRLVVVAAAYERHGLAGYDASSGEQLWQRTDLKRGQQVTPAGDFVTACFDQGPAHVVGALTGRTIATLRGVRSCWHSPFNRLAVGSVTGHLVAIDALASRQLWRVPIDGFAVLGAAFSPDAVVASDVVDEEAHPNARSSIHCLDLSGRVRWRYQSPPSRNCPVLGWDAATGEWLAVESDVDGRTEDILVRWSADGRVASRVSLGRRLGNYRFLPAGRRLLADRGEVIDTQTGRDISAISSDAAEV